MALVDDRPASQQAPDRGYDRQPPQDLSAEQSVLGGMMLSKDAIADVLESLRPADFYRPAHQAVYECVLDLYGRGEPADPVMVSAELERRGELRRVGGAPYLHTLIATVPTAANAGYYAEIVAEKAILRRLIEAGTRIVQMGHHGADGADVDEVVDRAQAAIYEVTDRRTSEDYVALEDLLQPTMDELEAIETRGLSFGVPTGFDDLDSITNGLHPGQMIIIAARPGMGKALALDTPLATPTGWTTMGEVTIGDQVLGADGRPTTVVAATEVLLDRPCFEVEFSDGSVIVADEAHQWLTETRASRRSAQQAAVRTTEEIRATLRCTSADGRLNHSVVNCSPLRLPVRDLLVPPYTLGAWLGDGSSRSASFTPADPEIAVYVEADELQYPAADPVQARLRTLGVFGNKHIPTAYLRAAEWQRRELLAGLLDTDGTVNRTGSVQFTSTSERLASDVYELVVGLGYRCGMSTKTVNGRSQQTFTAHTLTFAAVDDAFKLSRKQLAHKERRRSLSRARNGSRHIVDVRPVASVPVRCIQVDNGDHLYLAGRAMIPTHNSTLGLDFARSCSVRHGLASVIFSLEMSRTEVAMRLLSAEAGIPLSDMRTGKMNDDKWAKLARRMSEVAEAPLFIDDSPNLTMMEIRAKARRLKQRHDLRLVVVDYMQLMTSGKRVESRQQEVSEFSRNLKLLAKELEVPLVAMSQLNRGPEQRTDKKPMLGDLRESGCLTRATRVWRADTGAEVALGELLDAGEQPLVWSLDDRLRMVPRPMRKVFHSGVKEVFRLRLASGRQVEATANHPFLTVDGWVRLDELSAGNRIAVPRRVPAPCDPEPMPADEVVLLAHLIGDGSFVKRQPIRYASTDEANLTAVATAARHFGITAVRDEYPAARVTTMRLPAPYPLTHGRRNPIAAWLDRLGLFGGRSYEKFVPASVFGLPDDQVALFLRHLWATDGSVRWDERAGQARIYYASASRRLADDISRLLLRHGVLARLKRVQQAGHRACWHLYVHGAENQLKFLDDIGVHGARGVAGEFVAERLRPMTGSTNVDTVPRQVWDRVRTLLKAPVMTHRDFAAAMGSRFCGSTMWKHAPSRSRLARVTAVLDDAQLDLLAVNDVCWDEVTSITSIGAQPVYDAEVPGTHNFVADGVSVHNSLEQDADMVLLIHRPDVAEQDERPGEADLILAKHRNGPTSTVTVTNQLHLSRFANLARM